MRLSLLLCGVLVVAGCWGFSGAAVSEDDSSQRAVPKYESKIAVEMPAEMAVEKFIERALHDLQSLEPSPTPDRQPIAAQPGKVDWLADFETACRASRDSGKPVLLFQLMGRLDEVFC